MRPWRVAFALIVVGALIFSGKIGFGQSTAEDQPPSIEVTNPAAEPLGTGDRWLPEDLYVSDGENVIWEREQLTAEERDQLNSPDPTKWENVNRIYEQAAEASARDASARMTSSRLGVSELLEFGVVP